MAQESKDWEDEMSEGTSEDSKIIEQIILKMQKEREKTEVETNECKEGPNDTLIPWHLQFQMNKHHRICDRLEVCKIYEMKK
jgi:hypothetical protein